MPVLSVHRVTPYVSYLADGTQYIENEVVFPASGTTTIYLSREIFGCGSYVLFDYTASSSANPVQNLGNLALDISDLLLAGSYSITNVPTQKVVIATLNANPSNGTQYVEGTLNLSGATTIVLAPELYATPGTYVLFEYGSLVGSITNITILPPGGRSVDTGVSPNGCADTGTTITVTLL
ncbi:MAG: hypothetical protein KGS10_04475 [Chloroflexi bacterium]|nr:hypothetical protein [Chloroflexota bacterium]